MVEFVEVFTDWTSVKFTTLSGIYEDLLLKIVNYKKLNLATYWHKQYIETRMLNVNWEGTQIGYRSLFQSFQQRLKISVKDAVLLLIVLNLSLVLPVQDFRLIIR